MVDEPVIPQHSQPTVFWPLMLLTAFIVTLAGISLAALQYHQHSRSILAAGDTLFEHVSERVQGTLNQTYLPPRQALNLLALDPLVATDNLEQRLTHLPRMARVLTDNPQLNSLYIGWNNGDYLMLRPLRSDSIRERFQGPDSALWMAWHISAQQQPPRVDHVFLDSELQTLTSRQPGFDGFDPRARPWYQQARTNESQIITTPYVFFSTNEYGTTLARQAGAAAVLGADLTLTQLSHSLADIQITPSSERLLYANDGTVIAYHDPRRLNGLHQGDPGRLRHFNELGSTLLAALSHDGYSIERQTSLRLEGRQWRVLQQQLDVTGAPDTYLALVVPEDELLADAYRIRRESVIMILLFSLVVLPLSFLLMRSRIQHSQGTTSRL